MKKSVFLSVITCAVSIVALTGCEKFLDRKPLTSTLNDYAQGGVEPQALGLYGALRNSAGDPYIGDGFQSIPWIGINGFRSDDQEIVAGHEFTDAGEELGAQRFRAGDFGAGEPCAAFDLIHHG